MRQRVGFPSLLLCLAACVVSPLQPMPTALAAQSPYLSLFMMGSPYQSFADSPFSGQTFSYFYLEDFEDGALNTPGAASTTGGFPANLSMISAPDSVDGDDGVMDGSGSQGYSFYSGGYSQGTSILTFTFDEAVLGSLPTHVGIVWTDVGYSSPDMGFEYFTFSAFGSDGRSIGTIGPVLMGDGVWQGQTDEDRFFGAIYQDGISKITISMESSLDWEVDHLQYGFAPSVVMPAPGAIVLGGLGTVFVGWLRRRRAL